MFCFLFFRQFDSCIVKWATNFSLLSVLYQLLDITHIRNWKNNECVLFTNRLCGNPILIIRLGIWLMQQISVKNDNVSIAMFNVQWLKRIGYNRKKKRNNNQTEPAINFNPFTIESVPNIFQIHLICLSILIRNRIVFVNVNDWRCNFCNCIVWMHVCVPQCVGSW